MNLYINVVQPDITSSVLREFASVNKHERIRERVAIIGELLNLMYCVLFKYVENLFH